jgi:hypothetical protein
MVLVPKILGCLAVFSVLLISAKPLTQYWAEIKEKEALQNCRMAILSRLRHLDAIIITMPTKQRDGELLIFNWTSAALRIRTTSGTMIGWPAVCKFDLKNRQVAYLGFDLAYLGFD